MGRRVFQPLSVRGALDTENPISDRDPGTLVTALDLGHKWWGPRHGGKSFGHPHNLTAADLPRPGTLVGFGGAGSYVVGPFVSPDQRDLGTQWSLDLVFRADSVNHDTFDEALIFQWVLKTTATTIKAITVGIRGTSAGGDERKIRATITPTSAADTAATTKTLDGTTQLTVGTDQEDRHHVRLVRDGATATLFVNGVSEATASGMSRSNGHEGSSTVGQWVLGDATNPYFKGRIYYVRLRDGVFDTYPLRAYPEPAFPRTQTTKLQVAGSGTGGIVDDLSLFQSEGVETGTSAESEPDQWPLLTPVQAINHYTDLKGRVWNVVICGGMIYYQRLST